MNPGAYNKMYTISVIVCGFIHTLDGIGIGATPEHCIAPQELSLASVVTISFCGHV